MDSRTSPLAAVAGLALVGPALLFMTALVVRSLPALGLSGSAEQLVQWYASRMWTLWLLLLALPIVVFFGGVAALVQGARPRLLFGATTLLSGVILAIVFLHMGAN